MHVFLEPKGYQLLVQAIKNVSHPRRRSKFKLCAADGYSQEEWLRATLLCGQLLYSRSVA